MKDEIKEKLRITYLSGGTGTITTTDGKIFTIHCSSIVSLGNFVTADTVKGGQMRIQKSTILDAQPAH